MRFKDKVVVITGGSLGIGLAAAQLFAKEGARVVITGRNAVTLEAAKAQIKGDVFCFVGDVAQLSQLDQLYREVAARFGKIDVIFANAGIAETRFLAEVTEELFDTMMNINCKGVFFTVQKALPHLREGASIILNGSIAGLLGYPGYSVYSAGKAAVIQMAKNFAVELLSQKIRVNVISPGYTKTPIWGELEENSDEYRALAARVPLEQRFAHPDEVAQTVLFLASSAASYITAQNIVIDGGMTSFQHWREEG